MVFLDCGWSGNSCIRAHDREGNRMARILIVDDEESIRGFIAEALSLDHHSIEQAQSAEEALRLATPRRFLARR